MNFPRLKKTSSKQKIVNMLAFFILVLAADIYFVILPFKDEIIKQRRLIINEKINLEKQLIRQKNSASLENTINQVREKLKKIEGSYISKNNELEFITTIEGIASENRVQQKISLQPGEKKKDKKDSYMEAPLVLEISGKHDNIIKYLLDIETLNYYINIHSFEIASNMQAVDADAISDALGAKKQENNNLTARLTATTYWR